VADKAYDSDAVRKQVEDKGGWANIPPKSNRKQTFAFSKWLYRYRNLVERFFNKLKQFRGIATRYDKNPENFLAAVKRASVMIWLRTLMSLRPNIPAQRLFDRLLDGGGFAFEEYMTWNIFYLYLRSSLFRFTLPRSPGLETGRGAPSSLFRRPVCRDRASRGILWACRAF